MRSAWSQQSKRHRSRISIISSGEEKIMAIATRERLIPTSIDLPEKTRIQVIDLLNARLADTLDLKTQIKYAHWNVKGMNFHQLHLLFDTVAEHLEEHIDLLAERATALGGVASGTARQAAANSQLPEYPLEAAAGEEHVRAVVERLAKFARLVRADVDGTARLGDQSTADLLTQISREIDKDLWLVEAHLQA
jgi:starvation-inducible DNA-binding protein